KGGGTTNGTRPGLRPGGRKRGVGRSDFLQLVNQYNATLAGKKDAQGTTIPALIVPTGFGFGDDFQSEDIRITKTFKIRERFNIQGIFEVFNIFNISNLTFDSSTQNLGGSFGQPTGRAGQSFGTGGPRSLQLGARVTF